jgi:hypothetical protein
MLPIRKRIEVKKSTSPPLPAPCKTSHVDHVLRERGSARCKLFHGLWDYPGNGEKGRESLSVQRKSRAMTEHADRGGALHKDGLDSSSTSTLCAEDSVSKA